MPRRTSIAACVAWTCVAWTCVACASCGGTPAPATRAAPTPTEPTTSSPALDPQAKGRLAPEVIQKVVRADFKEMQRCYEKALGRNPELKGKITTLFVIDRDGAVAAAEETEGDGTPPRLQDPNVTACVVARFKALRFPPPEGGGVVKVQYPIVFKPAD